MFYLKEIKAKFKNKKFDSVYIAGVDANIVHFILSIIKFDKLITFDDGSANIVKNSVYYEVNKGFKNKINSIIYYLYGRRFNLISTKRSIYRHYTLFPDMDNIYMPTTPLHLFDYNIDSVSQRDEECIVILGTICREILKPGERLQLVIELIQNIIDNNKDRPVIFIPHPRGDINTLKRVTIDDRALLAEEKIKELIKQYKTVSIYGFCSTTQYNLVHLPMIKNYYFISSSFKKRLLNYQSLANQLGMIKVE